MNMIILWLVLMVGLLILEASTVNLVSIWFAIGSLGALITAIAGGPLWLQLVVFVIVSLISLLLTRPILAKKLKPRHQATNADMVFEQPAVVTERVDNDSATGTVRVGGKIWTARSADCSVLEPGTRVRVQSIQGVKLIVLPEDRADAT